MGIVQERLLPSLDLIWMDLVLSRQLCDRLVAANRLQSQLGFEFSAEFLSASSHFASP